MESRNLESPFKSAMLVICAAFFGMMAAGVFVVIVGVTGAWANLCAALGTAVVFTLVSVLAARIYGFSWARLGWCSSSADTLLLGAVLGALLMPVVSLLSGVTRIGLGGEWENPQLEMLDMAGLGIGAEVAMGLMVVIVVPLAEEIFFRGVLFELLKAAGGSTKAIYGSAGIFGLFHVEPSIVVGTFILGIALGHLRERAGSIWPAVLLHSTNNGLALLFVELDWMI